jgi:hypothetical protein
MENFFSHLKEEYLRQFQKSTFAEAQQLIAEYVYFYKYERIQIKQDRHLTKPSACRTNSLEGFLFLSAQRGSFQKIRLLFISGD